MYDLFFGIGIILFLATFIFPKQPTAALFWMGGVAIGMAGVYSANRVKVPFVFVFAILMILGTMFMFGFF
jgi:hypothetical protein